jgi:putative addiction module antidote
MIKLTIRKLDDGLGVVLPPELLATLDAGEGDTVFIVDDAEGRLLLTADEGVAKHMDAARSVMNRYRGALSKLADK